MHFKDIPQLRREIGNISKDIGIDADKIFTVALMALEENFDEQMKKLKKES